MVDDDLPDGDGDGGAGGEDAVGKEPAEAEREPEDGAEPREGGDASVVDDEGAVARTPETLCISCGAPPAGVYCGVCGQKNDDMRRSLVLLSRDFLQDTFSFDSRMWRTLGLLAVAPGRVAADYAHGKRSRYTPPVRLFLVVSFLFFLTLTLTQTLIAALVVSAPDDPDRGAYVNLELDGADAPDAPQEADDRELLQLRENCDLSVELEFFIRPRDLKDHDVERWTRCSDTIQTAIDGEIEKAREAPGEDGATVSPDEAKASRTIIETVFSGVNRAIADPKVFNAAFNNWLPRVMFLMTPVLALILGIFIRGRDALFFDHMVLSLYSHAVGFAAVGLAILAAQAGVPMVGPTAALFLAAYFVLALKRAYGRGWVKTVWTAFAGGLSYMIILAAAVLFIVVRIVMNGG